MTFCQKLRAIQKRNNSLLCIGLDTDIHKLPEFMFEYGDPVFEYNRRIIDATKDLVCAYKINMAFYEVRGESGWYTVHQTLARIPETIVRIADSKRTDIGNSSTQYAHLFMNDYEFDGITLPPYMGWDSIEPFVKRASQCGFILTLTSNPGSRDFQYLKVGTKPLYEKVVEKTRKWNAKKNLGLVVGATHPKELRRIRKFAPELPILIPGIGAQKGDLRSAVRYGCSTQGDLAIITVSRDILYASLDEHFARAARKKALWYREEINKYRKDFFG